ncbi:MAG: ribosome maturation factor RimP [Cyanobacteria bacterium P01_A01_bin.84]
MTHPLVPQIIELAKPVAEELELEIVGVVFHTNQSPPVLRIDIRNLHKDTSLNDCEQMSRTLENSLDAAQIVPESYVLEVSSPGVSRQLVTDREFISFKGFPVKVYTSPPYKGQREWTGQLIRRDDNSVFLNLKGRTVEIERSCVVEVELEEGTD